MNIDFSLLLLILSLISGFIWLIDAVVLARPRHNLVAEFLEKQQITMDEFREFLDGLDEDGRPLEDKKARGAEKGKGVRADPVRTRNMEHAWSLYRESVPVEYAKSFFPILFAVLLLRSFLFEPFQIPTGSMIPSLNIGDFIVVNKYSYGLRLPVSGTKILEVGEPERGDVMVFIPPHIDEYYIKRVIGLPGDHVQYRNNMVYINGEALPQTPVGIIQEQGVMHSTEIVGGVTHDIYTAASQRYSRIYDWLPPEGAVIPEGHYFMMGVNRDNSSDSRYWGPVPEENIVGKAVAVWMHKEPGLKLPRFSENRLIENAQ